MIQQLLDQSGGDLIISAISQCEAGQDQVLVQCCALTRSKQPVPMEVALQRVAKAAESGHAAFIALFRETSVEQAKAPETTEAFVDAVESLERTPFIASDAQNQVVACSRAAESALGLKKSDLRGAALQLPQVPEVPEDPSSSHSITSFLRIARRVRTASLALPAIPEPSEGPSRLLQ